MIRPRWERIEEVSRLSNSMKLSEGLEDGLSGDSEVEALVPGEDEDPAPRVACANFSRAEQVCLNRIASAFQLAADMEQNRCPRRVDPALSFESGGEDGLDVFQENKAWSNLLDPSNNKWEKVPWVIIRGSLAC